ncbi:MULTISPECIES: NAD(P)H-dependent oxidoreductase [Natrialbaceae]|uniref:NAD(P)H-dependent oxidoreductase n=1 Tax=Natrialbaceae TaxID=1644061 RepID=UPI00207CE896|nr:SAF domain-containing protein [Natronococcus sp. CG52]
MISIPTKLANQSDPIAVGVIGAGLFGENLIDQIEQVNGMKTAAIADIDTEKAKDAYDSGGVDDENIVTLNDPVAASKEIRNGNRVIFSDGLDLIDADIDVVVEATGIPNIGARHAYHAIQDKKHVVMVTVEADTVVGPILSKMAENNGVTYTMAYGDQPALIVELVHWAQTIGLNVVAAGKGNAYLEENQYETPDDVFDRMDFEHEFVEEHDLNPQMWNSFIDGSKPAIEMCAVANATGLRPDVPGMHYPTAEIPEIGDKLRPKSDGGILNSTGVVDTVSTLYPDGSSVDNDISNGIFVVTEAPVGRVQEYLEQYDGDGLYTSNNGKYQVFHRPFHLPGLETPVSIANAALRNEATGTSDKHVAEVVGVAKRDLEPGEEIDGGGGYTAFGQVIEASTAAEEDYVPFELLDGAEVTEEIAKDETITYESVDIDQSSFLYNLRQLQEELISVS